MEGDKMRLQGLLQPLQENDKFITAINSIKNKRFPINISGLSDSGKSYIIDGIFNEIDKTWDCPCHSSRFDIDGNIIKGPSSHNIKT